MTKRGRILEDGNASSTGADVSVPRLGLLTVQGKQYCFAVKSMWCSEVAPRAGMLVDVDFNEDGAPVRIFAVTGA